jgi:arabinan endo-1,5-alpha-L-arabinosidase
MKAAIGYATSADLETWKDQGSTGISSAAGNQYNAIDPNLLMDGSSYSMIFGSFFGDIFQVPMSSPSAASGFAAQIAFNATTNHSEEGAYMYKNGAYWYLFFSSGQCCGLDTSKPAPGEEYKIMVCRSTSSIGPFSDKSGNACTSNGGTIVLPSHGNVYAPGGQGVYDDPELGAVLYYHYVNIPDGYSDGAKLFGINVIDWTSGWPVV